MITMSYKLVLLRHGQSAWNKTDQFTGWVDVPLTPEGEEEARNAGKLLKEKNVLPDIVFTSLLRRAINTANISLDVADRLWIPVKRSWRLNERHYGNLQGKDKAAIRQEYGDEQFMIWRRSYATPPPDIDASNPYTQNGDPRYAGEPVPQAEALANVVTRVMPYWESDIIPELKTGKTVMIAAHGNSLRAIVKMLDGLSEDEISKVNIPTGIPLVYELDENFKPIKPRGEYLDPEAAVAGAAAVAAQGQGK
jgi:2,3-bisphosphoglycerate-dependent phosphoglycerate mutase